MQEGISEALVQQSSGQTITDIKFFILMRKICATSNMQSTVLTFIVFSNDH